MGIFNYIDTFFFISLGITFILILLLVFHFKQQLVSLEHKNDTMFEIINNIVKEITYVKSAIFSQPHYQANDKDEIINLSANTIPSKQMVEKKIVVSDDDYESDKESNEESNESDNESDNEKIIETDEEDNDQSDSDDESDESAESDESNSHNERIEHYEDETHENSTNVKVINIELGDTIEIGDTITELDDNNDANDANENEINNIEEINTTLLEETDTIIVEKLEGENNNLENITTIEEQKNTESIKEVYRKMSLSALKALVISKGLVSDSSRMKKHELIKLLESNIDENN